MDETQKLERDLKLLKAALDMNDMMLTDEFMERDPVLFAYLAHENQRICIRVRAIEKILKPVE